jgi:uncharacterized membrane protein YqgA involved in biofilm formation
VFPGVGTAVNIATVLLGAGLGVLLGNRLPQRTRDVVTDALGLVTLLVAGLTVLAVQDDAFGAAVGQRAPVLIVLGSLLVGGIVGSLLHLESRLEGFGGWLRHRLTRREEGASTQQEDASDARARFIEGFVTSSIIFCAGPLTILGSLSDGLGRGADQLFLKATLDGFAAIAFAASFGWGVAASAVTILIVQGSLTLVGFALGDILPAAEVSAISATGGLLLIGVAIRLLRLRAVPVADLLPALLVAPILTWIIASLR